MRYLFLCQSDVKRTWLLNKKVRKNDSVSTFVWDVIPSDGHAILKNIPTVSLFKVILHMRFLCVGRGLKEWCNSNFVFNYFKRTWLFKTKIETSFFQFQLLQRLPRLLKYKKCSKCIETFWKKNHTSFFFFVAITSHKKTIRVKA